LICNYYKVANLRQFINFAPEKDWKMAKTKYFFNEKTLSYDEMKTYERAEIISFLPLSVFSYRTYCCICVYSLQLL